MPIADAFRLLVILGIPTMCGIFLVMSLCKKYRAPWPLAVALGYGLGTGILAQWMFLLSILDQSFNILNMNLPLLLVPPLLSFAIIIGRKRCEGPLIGNPAEKIKRQPVDYLMLSFAVILVGLIFWRATHVPVCDWDAVATEVFRAKIFFYSKSLEFYVNTPHNSYPLHIPLLQTWLSINWGSWNEQYVKIFYMLYSLAFLVIAYQFLRNYCQRTWSMLGVVLILSSNLYVFHSTSAYRDLPMMFYNCVTILLLLFWNSKRMNGLLLLAGFFGGFTSFIKLEGTGLLAVQTVFLASLLWAGPGSKMEKFKQFAYFAFPAWIICLNFHLYQFLYIMPKDGITEPLTHPGLDKIQLTVNDLIPRVVTVVNRYFNNAFFSFNWNIVWFLWVVSLFNFEGIKKQRAAQWLLFAFFLNTFLYFCLFSFTQYYFWIKESSAALSRSLLHIFPLVCVLIVLINFGGEKTPKN